MDHLQAVVDTIVQQLPICISCRLTLCHAYIKQFYACWHFLCTSCDSEGKVETCPGCEGSNRIEVEMEEVGKGQWTLAESLNGFYFEGRSECFKEICDEFYRLSVCLAGGAGRDCTSVLAVAQRSVEILQSAPQSESVKKWTCPNCSTANSSVYISCFQCPYINLDLVTSVKETERWDCPCGASNPLLQSTCPCQRSRDSATQLTKVTLWPCTVCGYQYNLEDDPVCGKCVKERATVAKGHTVAANTPWQCEECSFEFNFRVDVCNKCAAKRGERARKDLWQCEVCGFMRNTTDVCSNCDNKRNKDGRNGEKREGDGQSPDAVKRRKLK